MTSRSLIAFVALAACKQPVSYEPKVVAHFIVELTLANFSVRRAEIEVLLPEGYRQTSPGIHDAYFARPKDKVNFNVKRFSPNEDRGLHDERPCGHDPTFLEGMKRLFVEKLGDHDELELCETRDLDGPTQYWVRRSVLVDDNWIECHGNMDGTEAEHRDDASSYTETQREQVLAVCRSMRIVSVGPPISIDEQRRALRR